MNYHNKKFRPVSNSKNGETSEETTFHYQQEGNILHCHYAGGLISTGHLIAVVDDKGHLDMRYHHINTDGNIMTGICQSTPELMPNGKIRLLEAWQWTCGDHSKGNSVLEEV